MDEYTEAERELLREQLRAGIKEASAAVQARAIKVAQRIMDCRAAALKDLAAK